MYAVDRSKNFKCLRLQNKVNVTDEGLIKAVQKLLLLEELQLIKFAFSCETLEAVGLACPLLKSFSLNQIWYAERVPGYENDQALVVARSMPHLRHLQLMGHYITNEAVEGILDGCPRLESLHIRGCFYTDLSGDLGKRCQGIKHMRYPSDSPEDYPIYFRGRTRTYDLWMEDEEEEEEEDYYDLDDSCRRYLSDW